VAIDAAGSLHIEERHAQCLCCRQNRVIVAANCCSACVLGLRLALVYECDHCQELQRIPHPMWRYQPTPEEFGNDTWACHHCHQQSHWRVHGDHLLLIPPEHCPEGWGRREEWLEQVRAQRIAVLARNRELGGKVEEIKNNCKRFWKFVFYTDKVIWGVALFVPIYMIASAYWMRTEFELDFNTN
jgi:hypothetical protein